MIAIIDYGAGNLKNVYNALQRLDMDPFVTRDPKKIDDADALILPGVGAFGDAMKNLRAYELPEIIRNNIQKGKYFLGICLGMQLIFEKSYEHGEHEGLGLLEGEILRFQTDLKVPHMGWNSLDIRGTHPILRNISNEYVYFVHSYYVHTGNRELILASTDYGGDVPAIIGKDNIIGMQFHPEKSGLAGDRLLLNFKECIS